MGETRPLLRAYVDETGDRGATGRSSPFFAMAAVVVADEDEPALRRAMEECRARLGVPAGKPLHWKEHVKVYPRRQFVTGQVAQVPRLMVNYVVFEKAAIPPISGLRLDQASFYNYTAGLIMESILPAARDWPGGARSLLVTFGHVRGFDHRQTRAYFERKRYSDRYRTPWSQLPGPPRFSATNLDGLQCADQYAGMLHAALNPDRFGGYEPHHLLAVRHQIRRVDGTAWGYGFKVMAAEGRMRQFPWWPREGI